MKLIQMHIKLDFDYSGGIRLTSELEELLQEKAGCAYTVEITQASPDNHWLIFKIWLSSSDTPNPHEKFLERTANLLQGIAIGFLEANRITTI